MSFSEWWYLVSGGPYHGWRRVAHSILVPVVVTVVFAWIAERIFG
jgi:hypothetical protein